MDLITLALSKKFTSDTADSLGSLKGAPCTIKSIVHQDGSNKVTFEWTGTSGEKQTTEMTVYDGTPIYVWESGNHYQYGDLCIYASCFYRCIAENSDTDFDSSKWNEINSSDLSDYYTKQQTDARITEKVAEIVADAPEDFNTLKEISDWISGHEDSAAAMNSAIQENARKIETKVDKVSGKELSTNDYTTAEKTKLAGLENFDDTELKQLTGNTYIPCSSAKILSSGDDLNNLTDYDIWLATNGTVAKSLLNCPHTEGGFLVWNSPVTTRFSNMFYQYLVGNNADDVLCYRRKWFDGTWNSWYKFTGTPV